MSKEGNKIDIEIKVMGSEGTVSADFNLLKKANAMITNMTTKKVNGEMVMNMDFDIAGAGDKVLFMGDFVGDDDIKLNPRKRAKACMIIGQEVADMFNDDEDSKKK